MTTIHDYDEAWLRSIGFEDDPASMVSVRVRIADDPYPAYLCLGSDAAELRNEYVAVFVTYAEGANGEELPTYKNFVVATNPGMMKTRKQVRRLLECLGLPLPAEGKENQK
jgi:hypothetical protein